MRYDISIVMSVNNGAKYLQDSIESVLNQSFTNFEFIIIDDCSVDDSLNIINKYKDSRIKVFSNNRNLGLASSLNKGILNANAKLIGRMDCDDICLPNRFSEQFNFMQNNNIVALGSNVIIIDQDGNELYTSNLPLNNSEIMERFPKSPFYHSSVLMKKESIFECGMYNEFMRTSQDVVLFNKLAKIGKLSNIKTPLLKYRILPDQISTRTTKENKKLAVIVNKAINDIELSDSDKLFLSTVTKKKNKSLRISKSIYFIKLAKSLVLIKASKRKIWKFIFLSFFSNPLNTKIYNLIILIILPETISKAILNIRIKNARI